MHACAFSTYVLRVSALCMSLVVFVHARFVCMLCIYVLFAFTSVCNLCSMFLNVYMRLCVSYVRMCVVHGCCGFMVWVYVCDMFCYVMRARYVVYVCFFVRSVR